VNVQLAMPCLRVTPSGTPLSLVPLSLLSPHSCPMEAIRAFAEKDPRESIRLPEKERRIFLGEVRQLGEGSQV
jgi:hypothetical protein